MTARNSSSSSLVLVNPLQAQWFSDRGEAMPPPQSHLSSVRVVADLVEENHVAIKVPGIVGRDRHSFIEGQYQALLPDVALRGAWEPASKHPVLPRPFGLHAVGVSSPTLTVQLDTLSKAAHPIVGVWTLSYLMAYWASRQAALASQSWLLLCLGLPYGMRMVLLHHGAPVFSRLLLADDPAMQAQEVGQTLKYLTDNRFIERDVRPAVLPLDLAPAAHEALQVQGLNMLTPAVPRLAGGMLADVLALAGPRAPGNLASLALRRDHLAHRTRQGLRLLIGVVLLAGVGGLLFQGKSLLDSMAQSRGQQQQVTQVTAESQAIRDDLAKRNINVPLLRLAMEVQQQELQSGVDPVEQLWRLGQLLKAHPHAKLIRTEQALREQACPNLQVKDGEDPAAVAPEISTLQTEWQFDVRPSADLLPRQRQALLESLAKTVASWPQWQVKTNPEQQESASAMTGGLGSAIDRSGTDWHWCLVTKTPDATSTAGTEVAP